MYPAEQLLVHDLDGGTRDAKQLGELPRRKQQLSRGPMSGRYIADRLVKQLLPYGPGIIPIDGQHFKHLRLIIGI